MEFGILGPLEAQIRGLPLRLEGNKQRILLCALLTSANEVTSTGRLIDWLWSRRPPRSAAAIVQTHVSRLRRAMEPDRAPWSPSELLVRLPSGYLLRIDPDRLDALRFTRLVADGRAMLERGAPEAAARVLSGALALWRGQALADVQSVDAARCDIERLEGLRLSATVMRIDADLELGRHVVLVPELEMLVGEHPLDERLCCQLMIALCRCGRRADAVATYERLRNSLAGELAIEPAPAIQRLHVAIVEQQDDLQVRQYWSSLPEAEPH